ncbi:MAG TPA: hypothetical protein VJ020_12815, partial [Anaerolineales bacterium]|nr:hypothetical protein [Anaerolineales bacterium]
SWAWAVAAGVFNGLTLYTYTSSRVFPAVVPLWFGALAFLNRRILLDNRGRIAAAIGLAVVIVAPFVNYALQYPDIVNQRANTTKGPLYDLPRGDPASLIDNTVKVAGMFTVSGDPDNRYTADARPIFDPVTGLLFYLGAGIGLWRLRHPAYVLLFIWLMVGLSPALLAEGAPVFHRALGSLFPIMVLPALAADWLLDRLPIRWQRWAAPGMLAGALILGLNTASIYFGSWRTSPRLMSVYESDLRLAARYLNNNPPPDGANVFIIAGAAADSAQIMFNLQAHNPPPLRWSNNFVWPGAPAETWYLFSQESLPDEQTRRWLGVAPAHREQDNAGNTVLEIYRLPASPSPPTPTHSIQARFDQLANLIGVTYLTPFVRGGTAEVALFWQTRPDLVFDPADLPSYRLRLQSNGIIWTETTGLLSFPPTQWQPGDIWVQRATLKIPTDMPAAVIEPELVLYTRQRVWPTILGDEELARSAISLPAVEISGHPIAAALADAHRFGDVAEIVITAHTPDASPGAPVFVNFNLRALGGLDQDYALQIQLVDGSGDELAIISRIIWQDVYPTSHWQSGEQILCKEFVRIPTEAESGNYEVRVRLVDESGQPVGDGGWVEAGSVRVSGAPRVFTRPSIDSAVNAEFGGVARLVGYRLDLLEARPGGSIKITLVWQALQPSPVPLKVFTHLYGLSETTTVYAQHDGLPANGVLTDVWLPGEYVEDVHILAIDPSVAPGEYRLGAGLYDSASFQRLTVLSASGELDVVILTQIELR